MAKEKIKSSQFFGKGSYHSKEETAARAYAKKHTETQKESKAKTKAHDKEHAKYLKERAARHKREGITG